MAEKFAVIPLLTSRFDRAPQLALDHHRMRLGTATKISYACTSPATSDAATQAAVGELRELAEALTEAVG